MITRAIRRASLAARQAVANWLLRGVHLREVLFGTNTVSITDRITMSTVAPAAAGQIGMNATTGRPRAYVGGAATDILSVADAGLGHATARKTADESVSSGDTGTTLQDDDHLSFPIAASEEWVAEIDLDVGAALATTGIKVAVTVPSGATLNVTVTIDPDVVVLAGTYYKRTTTGGAALDFTTTNLASAGDAAVRVAVWVLNSTNAGTVRLQFAQSTSSATALTARKGSMLRAARVA